MPRYALADLHLGLRDLFDKRLTDLQRSRAGQYYEAELREHLKGLEALPPAVVGGLPHAQQLGDMDTRHDGLGEVIFFTTEAVLRDPDASVESRTSAQRVRDSFVPKLRELADAYATEAERALERKPLLLSMEKELRSFPVVGGRTLFDVATAFLEAGEKLHTLLSARGDVPRGMRKGVAALRSAAVVTLNRCRAELRREGERTPSPPRDTEGRVLCYFDVLEPMQTSRSSY